MSRAARPTLAQVAERAGVSLKTASRVINGEYGVAAATAERVQETARELGFRPNHLARALASRQASAAVGLLIPDLSDPFIAALAAQVESTMTTRDFQLMSASHGNDAVRQRRLTRTLVERRVDALVVVSAPGDTTYLQADIDHSLVVVAVDRPLEGVGVDTVTVDNEAAARIATTQLLDLGHRRIAALCLGVSLWTTHQRFEGYRNALQAARTPIDPALLRLECRDAGEVQAALAAMLRKSDPPTAVIAMKNDAGRAAIRAMVEAQVVLDLAVFDEVADPDLLVIPPSTEVESDPARLGAAAATMALERLDGLLGPPRSVVLEPLFEHPRSTGLVRLEQFAGRPPAKPRKRRLAEVGANATHRNEHRPGQHSGSKEARTQPTGEGR